MGIQLLAFLVTDVCHGQVTQDDKERCKAVDDYRVHVLVCILNVVKSQNLNCVVAHYKQLSRTVKLE